MTTTIPGRWALTMRTPVGSIDAVMTFSLEGEALTGIAEGRTETVPLQDIRTEDAGDGHERVIWRQSITKPMRLTLDFDVIVTGDELDGHSRAGRLPRSTVTGRRLPADGEDAA